MITQKGHFQLEIDLLKYHEPIQTLDAKIITFLNTVHFETDLFKDLFVIKTIPAQQVRRFEIVCLFRMQNRYVSNCLFMGLTRLYILPLSLA